MADSATPPCAPNEQWLSVADYEGLYLVSSGGRVWSVLRRDVADHRSVGGILLRPALSTNGYLAVTLFRNGQRRRWLIHQLVAAAFIGPCPPGQEVRHGPNGKQDNRASELCYGTRTQNNHDKRRDGTMLYGAANAKARLTDAAVLEIRARYEAGESQYALAREFGVVRFAIGAVVQAKTWRHLGGVPLEAKPSHGEWNVQAKLTEAIVRECRARRAAGATYASMAREFGVWPATIRRAVIGEGWCHVA